MDNNQSFVAGFEPVSIEAWKTKLEKDLKGITFENLSSKDRNGIEIQAFYTDTPTSNTVLPIHADWYIMDKMIVDSDEKQANEHALWLLNQGISGLYFVVNKQVNWELLLNNISLQHIHLIIEVHESKTSIQSAFYQYLERIENNPAELSIQWIIADAFEVCENTCSNALYVNGIWANNVGANAVTELAAVLSQVNEGLNQLSAKGLNENIRNIYVSLAVDTNYFEQISKVRAFRILIANLMKAYQIQAKLHLHVETSAIFITQADMYNNLLRTTIAGMAAVLGGADSLYIKPFSTDDSDFPNRMSRNQQLLFKEEAYLHHVQDVASGAYFIERYTISIAEQAWVIFQNIETAGGFHAVVDSGALKADIAQQAQELIAKYKAGEFILLGVNKYRPSEAVAIKDVDKVEMWGMQYVNIEQALLLN